MQTPISTFSFILYSLPSPLPYPSLLCPLQNLSCLVPYPFPYLTVLFLSPTLSLIHLFSPLFPTLSLTFLFFSCSFLSPLPQSPLPILSFAVPYPLLSPIPHSSHSLTLTLSLTYSFFLVPYPLPYLNILSIFPFPLPSPLPILSFLVPYPFLSPLPYSFHTLSPTLSLILPFLSLSSTFSLTHPFFSCPLPSSLPTLFLSLT